MSRPTNHLPGAAALTDAETERLTRRGLRLAQFTIDYNLVGGAVAIHDGRAS